VNVVFYFVDVGQGDCTIGIDRETRAAILIDCPAGKGQFAVETLRQAGEGISLATVLVSHSHLDHMGGVFEVLSQFVPEEIRYNHDAVLPVDLQTRRKLRAALRAFEAFEDQGVRLAPLLRGSSGVVGSLEWFAISPTYGRVSGAAARGDPNYASAVILVKAGSVRLLVSGDADSAMWRTIIDEGADIRADVFRLPHHGAEISASGAGAGLAEILETVKASHHIISVGTVNTFGHPAQATLEELRSRLKDARLMCTEVNQLCLGKAPLPRDSARRDLPRSSLLGAGDLPGACRCAGTITVEIDDTGFDVTPTVEAHNRVVGRLESPMSRQ